MKTTIILLGLFLLPIVSAAQFTYEESTDPNLIERCFLAPEEFASFQTGTLTRSISPNSEREEQDATTPVPIVEDLLYGQLLDAEGNPWGGQTIRIYWFQANSEVFLTTKTLTLGEAQLFGDASFEGFYFFSRKKVGDDYRIEVVEKVETPVRVAENNTEETLPARESEVVTQSPRSEPIVIPPQQNVLRTLIDKYWWIFISFVVLVAVVFLYQWRFKKSINAFFFRAPKLGRSVAQLYKKPTKVFMQTEFSRIDQEAGIRDLITEVLHGDFAVVEKDGTFMGLITAEDLLEPLFTQNQLEVTITQLLKHTRTITPVTPFSQVALLGTEYRVLPVVKNGVCVGIVERANILSLFDELFSLNPSAVRKVAKLQHAIHQATTIAPTKSVQELVEKMITEDVNTIVIVDDKPQAIVTEQEVLQELLDYKDTLDQLPINTFGSRLFSAEATSSLLDANRMMLDANLRAIPIVHKGVLVGVLTQRIALQELQAALKEHV